MNKNLQMPRMLMCHIIMLMHKIDECLWSFTETDTMKKGCQKDLVGRLHIALSKDASFTFQLLLL